MKRNPILLISFVWAIGLFIGRHTEITWTKLIVGFTTSLVLFIMSFYLYSRKSNAWMTVLLGSSLLFGIAYMQEYQIQHQTDISANAVGETIGVRGYIDTKPIIDGNQVKLTIHPISYEWDKKEYFVSSSEKMIVSLYLNKEKEKEQITQWEDGMGILIYGQLDHPSSARNPGMFDYQKYLANKNIHWQLKVKNLTRIQVVEHWTFSHILTFMQERSAKPFDDYLSSPQSGFMKSLILGDRQDLSNDIHNDFSILGLSHLIAISGLHLTVFSLIIYWILSKLGLTKESRAIVTAVFLIFYMFFTGVSASVVRATIMALLTLYGVVYRKSFITLQSIGLTLILMTLFHPYWLEDIGFQLSFVVTFFLIWGYPKIDNILANTIPSFIRPSIGLIVITQLSSFPLVFYYFHQYSLLSWLANLIFVPIFSFIVLPFGLLLIILGLFLPYLAIMFGEVLNSFLKLLFYVINQLSQFQGLEIYQHLSIWVVLFLYVLLIWLLLRKEVKESFVSYKLKRFLFLLEKGVIVVGIVFVIINLLWSQEQGIVTMIDVGQGDSILIQSPQGRTILIDSGGTLSFGDEKEWEKKKDTFDTGEDIILPYLHYRGIKNLDFAVLTHEDADHIEGYLSLVDQIPIRQFVVGNGFPRTEMGKELQIKLIQRHIPIKVISTKTDLIIDSQTRFSFFFLGNGKTVKENNLSLVSLLNMYNTSFAFMGDLEVEGEEKWIQNNEIPAVDFMKVGHHGSKTSTSDSLLYHLKPKEALISVGQHNLYHHPSNDVVERLVQKNIRIWRTDQDGAVLIRIKSKGYQIEKTQKKSVTNDDRIAYSEIQQLLPAHWEVS